MTTATSAGAEAGTVSEFQAETSVPSSTPSETSVRFDDLGLSPDVLRAVTESGYTTPTPIQAKGIPEVLKRRDIIGIAQTGTGKTASFTLPMIEMLARGRAKARMPRSLILEPTRELAAQVAESFERYGKYNKLSMALLIGGVSFEDQDRKLDRGVDVLIATPGRLLDQFERGKLMLSQVQILVVDEADRMLDMGFIPDVERICKLIPFTRQTLFYSATMPPEIQRLTEQFLHNPVRVEVARPATTATNITQEVVYVPNNDWAKREGLRRLIRECEADIKNAIVFCNRKRDVDVVAKSLVKHGFSAAPLHGDLDQSLRTKTLDAFRANELTILVASDVAARGLDIPAVSHIFNFDVPFHADDYVHRIGRTGRAGRSGHAFMLATERDGKNVDAIEKLTGGKAIPKRTLEGIEVREDRGPRREERGRGRGGRDRDRAGGRDRQRERPVKPHGQVASMDPIEPAPPREMAAVEPAAPAMPVPQVQEPAAPRVHEPVRQGRNDHRRDHRPGQSGQKPQKQQQQKQQRADDGVPDGSRLPAFLFRPVPLPKPEKPATPAPTTADSDS
jgi:superfamily II DNA/RNA helicase